MNSINNRNVASILEQGSITCATLFLLYQMNNNLTYFFRFIILVTFYFLTQFKCVVLIIYILNYTSLKNFKIWYYKHTRLDILKKITLDYIISYTLVTVYKISLNNKCCQSICVTKYFRTEITYYFKIITRGVQ